MNIKPSPGTNSFGEKQAMAIVKKYLPYLKVYYNDVEDRADSNISYGNDEDYELRDSFYVETGVKFIDDLTNVNLLLVKPFDEDGLFIKFYMDDMAYIPDYKDDEYGEPVDPVEIETFTQEDWENILSEMKEEYSAYEEDEDDEDDEEYDY